MGKSYTGDTGYGLIMFAIALPGVAEPGSRPAPVALSVFWWTPYSFLSLKDPFNEESQYMLMKTYRWTWPLILFEKHTGSLAYSALYTVSFSKMYLAAFAWRLPSDSLFFVILQPSFLVDWVESEKSFSLNFVSSWSKAISFQVQSGFFAHGMLGFLFELALRLSAGSSLAGFLDFEAFGPKFQHSILCSLVLLDLASLLHGIVSTGCWEVE